MSDYKKEKCTAIQMLVVISLVSILIWDVFFNKNVFNISHLALSIILIVTIFDKYKFDSLNIKIPGLLEIAESNKEINRNFEKIINKIGINATAKANSKIELNTKNVVIKMPDGKEIDPGKIKDSETSLG